MIRREKWHAIYNSKVRVSGPFKSEVRNSLHLIQKPFGRKAGLFETFIKCGHSAFNCAPVLETKIVRDNDRSVILPYYMATSDSSAWRNDGAKAQHRFFRLTIRTRFV